MARAERPLLAWSGVFGAGALALTVLVLARGTPLAGDVRLTRAVQSRESFDGVAALVNAAGTWNWIPFLVAGGVLLFHGRLRRLRWTAEHRHREALYTFIAALGLRFVDQVLKVIVEAPRPTEAFGVQVDRLRATYGFPSGHVYGNMLFLGVMAMFASSYLPPRMVRPTQTVLCAVILLGGPARVFVGAHWPSDVAGGYLWGAAALCLAAGYGRWASRVA